MQGDPWGAVVVAEAMETHRVLLRAAELQSAAAAEHSPPAWLPPWHLHDPIQPPALRPPCHYINSRRMTAKHPWLWPLPRRATGARPGVRAHGPGGPRLEPPGSSPPRHGAQTPPHVPEGLSCQIAEGDLHRGLSDPCLHLPGRSLWLDHLRSGHQGFWRTVCESAESQAQAGRSHLSGYRRCWADPAG